MAIQGIIRPPPEIRAVADKTAVFVAKNGRDFEKKILNSAKGKTPKFAFLHESSPFHAYYEDRIVFYANGGGGGDPSASASSSADKQQEVRGDESKQSNQKEGQSSLEKEGKEEKDTKKSQTDELNDRTARKAKSIVDPVAKALLLQRAKIKQMNEESTQEDNANKNDNKSNEETDNNLDEQQQQQQQQQRIQAAIPPRPIYTTPIPPKSISPCQLEIIKVTAQFVALGGSFGGGGGGGAGGKTNVFMRELTIQEWENPIYGFLQPRHGHYAYFTQLVDIYRRILQRTVLIHEQRIAAEKKSTVTSNDNENISSSSSSYDKSLLTLTTLKKIVGFDGSEQSDMNALEIKNEIDSIEKMAGDIHSCLDHAAYHAEYERYNEEKRQEQLEKMMNQGDSGILGGSARVDWHDFIVVETIDFPVDEVVKALPPPPPPVPEEKVKDQKFTFIQSNDSDDDDKEEIIVVSDYKSKVVSSKAKFASESRTHVIDPISKRSIPIADMSEHMRIQLLDPKWAEEKERFLEKQKDSNLVGGDMIAQNVNALLKARGGLFSSSEQDTTQGTNSTGFIREQSVGPNIPYVGQFPQSTQMHLPSMHERPPMELPDAKRVRIENNLMQQGIPPPPPPPPPPLPQQLSAVLPGSYQPEGIAPPPSENVDTEATTTRLSEIDFVKSLDDHIVNISILVPNDDSFAAWNFNGQTLSISIDVMSKIKGLKQKMQSQLGDMPINKMQLKSKDFGFLKDASSLASLNIGSHSQPLELVPKIRGGRK